MKDKEGLNALYLHRLGLLFKHSAFIVHMYTIHLLLHPNVIWHHLSLSLMYQENGTISSVLRLVVWVYFLFIFFRAQFEHLFVACYINTVRPYKFNVLEFVTI